MRAFLSLAFLLALGVSATVFLWSATTSLVAGLVSIGFVGVSGAIAILLRRNFPHDRLGLCNAVTLTRMALVAILLGPILSGSQASWPVFAIAALALSLDGIDGWLARRQEMVSVFGARFDMEVDAALALALAVHAAQSSLAGPVAILLGLPRYIFALAEFAFPWMGRQLPERFSRKTVCVVQLGVLIALQAPVFPEALGVPAVAVAAGALVWSFALDLRWLWQRRAG